MTSRATLLLKEMSMLSELEISLLSLSQRIFRGGEPATRASNFTSLPSESSLVAEGFLVKLGGILRSEKIEQKMLADFSWAMN